MRLVGTAVAAAALWGVWACGHEEGSTEGARPLEVTAVFGEVGLNPGQFTFPRAVANDGEHLWVIDKSARVQRIDPRTGQSSGLWTMPEWEMGKPCGVSAGPDGILYIPDTHYFRVMEYTKVTGLGQTPRLVSSFGSLGPGPGQFTYCTDIGILASEDGKSVERLYVGEYGGNDRVSVFDRDHQFLFSFGSYGDSAEASHIQFSRPQSVEVDRERQRVVVTDACNHRIGVFDLEGKLVRWIGRAGTGPEEFAYPYGLALVGDGTALVTEFGNHRVHHVDYQKGESLGVFGKPGRGRGELTNPWALTVMGDSAYVVDSGNDRIQVFRVPRKRESALAHPRVSTVPVDSSTPPGWCERREALPGVRSQSLATPGNHRQPLRGDEVRVATGVWR